MKRLVVTLTSIIVTFLMLMTGCSQPAANSENSVKDSKVTSAGTFPITDQKVTLKVMVVENPLVQDFSTNEFTKWYEEKTNVHIDWEVVPLKNAQDKLNLMLSSGDYPDVIMGFNVNPTQQMTSAKQGIFIPLNDLIEKYGVQTKQVFKDISYVKDLSTAPDGNIYSLPQVNECYHCFYPNKMWIYQPWLDKLGLKMPTTTDEFEEVLKAFKEKDPNGNGKADEIPLTASITPQGHISLVDYLMNAFIYSNDNYLTLNNSKVSVAFNQPDWKAGLQYLHQLYTEKLIAPQSFTQDTNQLKQIGENPDTPILGAAAAENMGQFTQFFGNSGRWLQYSSVPPLKGPQGLQIASENPYGVSLGNFIITSSCKDPAVAFRWADEMYDREVTMRSVFGRPDQDWAWAKAGDIGINGKPAVWKRLANFGQVQNIHWAQTGPSLRSFDYRLSEAVDQSQPGQEIILYNETKKNYEPYKPNTNQILPPLYFTSDQASELADLSKSINDYVNEMIARFVTGDANLDNDWNSYLKTLDSMNLKRYIEIYQSAYDAKYKKK